MTAETTTSRNVTSSRKTDDGLLRSVRVTRSRTIRGEDELTLLRLASGHVKVAIKTSADADGDEPRTQFATLTLTPDEALHVATRLRALAIVGLAGLPEQSS